VARGECGGDGVVTEEPTATEDEEPHRGQLYTAGFRVPMNGRSR
jgi:hypothetical protein